MRAIRIPAPDAEALRHLSRDRGTLQKEAEQHRDRIRKLLRMVGCWLEDGGDLSERIAGYTLRCADGSPLPDELQERLLRECQRLTLVEEQFNGLEKEMIEKLPPEQSERIASLQKLKGVGHVGAVRLVLELFWRRFQPRQQVGACVCRRESVMRNRSFRRYDLV